MLHHPSERYPHRPRLSKPSCLIACLTLCLLLPTACGQSESSSATKSKAKGKSVSAPYELLVVCNKEWLGTSAADPFNTLLHTEVPALPQSEPLFRLTTINPSAFSKSFQFYANILRADISSHYETASCQWSKDTYCSPQLIATLTAPTQAAFDSLLQRYGESILQAFVDQELQQEEARLKRKHSQQALRGAKDMFGITIYAPAEIDALKTGDHFFWASSNNTEENYYNLVLYSYPLPIGDWQRHRDEAMRPYITGQTPGSYMSLDTTLLISRSVEVHGREVLEVRGLWQMEHAAMGGPFISHTYADTLHQRVLVAEAFVFAPGKDKRTYMRRLEAALRTIQP